MYVPTKRNDIGVLQQFFSHSHVSSFFHQLEHSDLKVKGNACEQFTRHREISFGFGKFSSGT